MNSAIKDSNGKKSIKRFELEKIAKKVKSFPFLTSQATGQIGDL